MKRMMIPVEEFIARWRQADPPYQQQYDDLSAECELEAARSPLAYFKPSA
jgi:hypothetical protein